MSRIPYGLPSRLGITGLWRAIEQTSVPVLVLHGVLPDADTSPFNTSGKFVTPRKLEIFLRRVSRLFRIVSLDDFVRARRSNARLTNAMVITFDDGYRNIYRHAFPVLRGLGFPFAIFVTTGYLDTDMVLWNDRLEFAVLTTRERALPAGAIGPSRRLGTPAERRAAALDLKDALKRKPRDEASDLAASIFGALGADPASPRLDDVRFLRSREVAEMAAAGVAIGAHSVTHPVLSREGPERIRQEVFGSKAALETLTGKPVTSFAYPNGRREDFSLQVKECLSGAGYIAAFTTIHGLNLPGDDMLEVKRIAFDNSWSYAEFETRTSGVLKALRR
jgi:peptidoglycan/xylan/chitin deacetylase (PgdA/CDA1 family)